MYWWGLNKRTGRVQCRGEIICLEMAGEKRQPSSSPCSPCSVKVSVALTTTLHAHQARCIAPTTTSFSLPQTHTHTHTHKYTHCTYPTMQRLILTSVIFTEALRESNHESSVWRPECSLFCWAVLLDSTPQHSCTHRPHATHSDIKSSLQIGDARQTENTTRCCRHTQITWFCRTLCNGITTLVALTVNGL